MEILHKKEKSNVVSNALSRKDEEPTLLAVSIVVLEWFNEIRSEYAKDPKITAIINNLRDNSKFEWKNDILWYKGRIYLNSNSKFKSKILKESHDSLSAGHVGFFKTYNNARQSFFWNGMSRDIKKYVAECDKCQRNKSENIMTRGLLRPLNILNQKWEEISMDFIEGLPVSEDNDKTFVVVNKLTKYAHFVAMKKSDSAKQIA